MIHYSLLKIIIINSIIKKINDKLFNNKEF